MYYHLIPVPFVIAGIAVYFHARAKNNLKLVAVVQPLNTILTMAIALLSLAAPHHSTAFTLWITAGLALALLGDFLNVDMGDQRTVIRGLVIFVFAYLVYSVGLTVHNGFHAEDLPAGAVMLLIYGGFMAYIWKGLGEMRLPVLIYGLNIAFMVTRAASTFFGETFSAAQAVLLTAGTFMLFLGDMEFAVHTFRKPLKLSLGPILYGGGQLLIGLSPSYFAA